MEHAEQLVVHTEPASNPATDLIDKQERMRIGIPIRIAEAN